MQDAFMLATTLKHLELKKSQGLDYIFHSLHSMPGQLSNLGYVFSSLPSCTNSQPQGLEKSNNSCDP